MATIAGNRVLYQDGNVALVEAGAAENKGRAVWLYDYRGDLDRPVPIRFLSDNDALLLAAALLEFTGNEAVIL